MLTFKKFVQLLEAKIDEYKALNPVITTIHDPYGRYTEPSDIIDHFHSYNPTGNVNHTRWVIGQYNKGDIKQEDAPDIKDTLTSFNSNGDKLEKKKIEQYKSIYDLRNALSKVEPSKTKMDVEKDMKDIEEGSSVIFDTPNLTIRKVETTPASRVLGKGLPWCTSRMDDKNMFNHIQAMSNNRFYILKLHNEEHPYRRIGLGVGTNEFQDENNETIRGERLKDLVTRVPDLKEVPALQGSLVALTKNPPDHVVDLLNNDYDELYKHVDKNPGIYDSSRRAIFDRYTHEMSLANMGTPSVADSEFHDVAKQLAAMTSSRAILSRLSRHPSVKVRSEVGKNVFTPPMVGYSLLDDPVNYVRASVAVDHIFTPKERKEINKKEDNFDILNYRLLKEKDQEVSRDLVDFHRSKFEDHLERSIKKGATEKELEHAKKHGYITQHHIKLLSDNFLNEIRTGKLDEGKFKTAKKYNYISPAHIEGGSDILSNKIQTGASRYSDLLCAKENGFLLQSHKNMLEKELLNHIIKGTAQGEHFDLAREFGYMTDQVKEAMNRR